MIADDAATHLSALYADGCGQLCLTVYHVNQMVALFERATDGDTEAVVAIELLNEAITVCFDPDSRSGKRCFSCSQGFAAKPHGAAVIHGPLPEEGIVRGMVGLLCRRCVALPAPAMRAAMLKALRETAFPDITVIDDHQSRRA